MKMIDRAKADVVTEEPPQLLTTREIAKRLAVGKRTVERLAASGRLPAVRIGRLIRFKPADLAAFIDGCQAIAT
jgi:excisionase family DNA binding protein